MDSENEIRKDDIYSTACFSDFPFSSCKRENENMHNASYFYFSFFVRGLRKRKRILRYPFPIFYHAIEKRKTKGRYIHEPWCLMYTEPEPVYRCACIWPHTQLIPHPLNHQPPPHHHPTTTPTPWTKWPPFHRRYLQMHFPEWKVCS